MKLIKANKLLVEQIDGKNYYTIIDPRWIISNNIISLDGYYSFALGKEGKYMIQFLDKHKIKYKVHAMKIYFFPKSLQIQ